MNKNEVKEILNKTLNPRELAREKFCAYKNYILGIFEEISNLISNDEYEKVLRFCFDSPAGDAWGLDNTVIDFGFDEKSKDILQALNYLSYLKKYYNKDLDIDAKFTEWKDYICSEVETDSE